MNKHIRDTVLGEIEINDKLVWNLIHTRDFQRLRQIKQLSATNYFYPSAEHSRFVHSLGVYEIARRILLKFNQPISDFDTKSILVASLLHDLGHGPYSHIFESTFSNINHEKITVKIINSNDSEVNKILRDYDPNIIKSVSNIISKKHKISWFNQILSSEIDVDRIDYLLRDDYLTSAGYSSFNFNWLINGMKINKDKIVFNYNALSVVESFLIGRYHMFKNVYDHPVDISFSELLKYLSNRINYLIKNKKNIESKIVKKHNFLNFDFKNFDYEHYFKLVDNSIYSLIYESSLSSDPLLEKIGKCILDGRMLEIFNLDILDDRKKFKSATNKKIMNHEYSSVILEDNFYEGREISKVNFIVNNKEIPITKISKFFNNNNNYKKFQKRKIGYLLK